VNGEWHGKTGFRCNIFLPLLNHFINEFFHLAAFKTKNVVVMLSLIEFKDRDATFEVMARYKTGTFKLGKYTIYRCDTHVFPFFQQCLINILGAKMANRALLHNLQNFYTRYCRLQPRFTKFITSHGINPQKLSVPKTILTTEGLTSQFIIL